MQVRKRRMCDAKLAPIRTPEFIHAEVADVWMQAKCSFFLRGVVVRATGSIASGRADQVRTARPCGSGGDRQAVRVALRQRSSGRRPAQPPDSPVGNAAYP